MNEQEAKKEITPAQEELLEIKARAWQLAHAVKWDV